MKHIFFVHLFPVYGSRARTERPQAVQLLERYLLRHSAITIDSGDEASAMGIFKYSDNTNIGPNKLANLTIHTLTKRNGRTRASPGHRACMTRSRFLSTAAIQILRTKHLDRRSNCSSRKK